MQKNTLQKLDVDAALKAVDEHFDAFVSELQEFCKIRSRRQEADQMQRTADFIVEVLKRWGGDGRTIPWEHSHPYVIGEFSGGPKRILHFNHYDVEVEPTGDEAEWISPPYAAEIRDGCLYARGVADDKGALLSRIYASAAWKLSGQTPPVTTRFIAEGKEWLHSPGLGTFMAAHADELSADAALWENSWIDDQDRPLLKLSEKGVLYLKLVSRTLERELTSQNTALLPSATTRLVNALAALQAPNGDVLVPGFDQGVRKFTETERELLEEVPFDSEYLKHRSGLQEFKNGIPEDQAGLAVRAIPTLTISGIEGGDRTQDVTLGVPATAWAKLEIRLIPDQDPQEVRDQIAKHLSDAGFADIEVQEMARSHPNATSHEDPFVALVAEAAREVYGTEPVVEPFTTWIGNQGVAPKMPIIGVGVSRADAGIDGPNEHIRLEDFRLGIKHVVKIMAAMASENDQP